jgi:hypothetical protein
MEIGALTGQRLDGSDLRIVATRFDVFTVAVDRVVGAKPLYLEFGVFEGETIRWWSRHLDHPAAQFIGFDSFEGLPETWRPAHQQGAFGTDGPPVVEDPRVRFVAGWFDDTLPRFSPPDHDQLIVNVDCDLYSSAKAVLAWMAPHLRTGSLLYFDELADRDHELRALEELLAETEIALRPIAAGGGGAHMLFEVA